MTPYKIYDGIQRLHYKYMIQTFRSILLQGVELWLLVLRILVRIWKSRSGTIPLGFGITGFNIWLIYQPGSSALSYLVLTIFILFALK